jgi:hypothetical protein
MKVSQIVKRNLLTEKQFSAKKVDSLQKKIKNKKLEKYNLTFCPLSSTQSANLEQFEIGKNEIKDQLRRITSLHQKP